MNRILSWFLIALIFAMSGPLQAASMASAPGFRKPLYGRFAPWADKYAYCGGDPMNGSDPMGTGPGSEPGPDYDFGASPPLTAEEKQELLITGASMANEYVDMAVTAKDIKENGLQWYHAIYLIPLAGPAVKYVFRRTARGTRGFAKFEKYARKGFNKASDSLEQLESIEKHQDILKGANKLTDEGTETAKKVIDSKQKSKSRWKNATKGIKNLQDAINEDL